MKVLLSVEFEFAPIPDLPTDAPQVLAEQTRRTLVRQSPDSWKITVIPVSWSEAPAPCAICGKTGSAQAECFCQTVPKGGR